MLFKPWIFWDPITEPINIFNVLVWARGKKVFQHSINMDQRQNFLPARTLKWWFFFPFIHPYVMCGDISNITLHGAVFFLLPHSYITKKPFWHHKVTLNPSCKSSQLTRARSYTWLKLHYQVLYARGHHLGTLKKCY